MIVAFFESFKYVGHYVPIAFFRIYFGYFFLNESLNHFNNEFTSQPILAARINEWLPSSQAPEWVMAFMENIVIEQWQIFAHMISYTELIIGISFIVGFLVRPVALVGILMCFCFSFISDPNVVVTYKLYAIVFAVLAWMGAGRCLGIDYFFFKRQRGIWW